MGKLGKRPTFSDDDIQNRIGAIAAWKRNGLTNAEIAHNLDIALSTLYEYQNRYPDLADALKASRDEANAQVENALHKNAMSGNIAAQIFWLKNRKSSDWRDKQEIDHKVEAKVTLDMIQERMQTGFSKFMSAISGGK